MIERIGRDKQSAIDSWNTRAAIASMQGEAKPYAKITFCALEGWADVDEIEGVELIDGTVTVYIYAPDSAARIAEQAAEIARLTKELEEAKTKLSNLAVVGFYNFKLHRFFDDDDPDMQEAVKYRDEVTTLLAKELS